MGEGEFFFGCEGARFLGFGEVRISKVGGHLLEFFDGGELVDIFEAEAEEKFFGGFVEDGAADDLFASGGGDELAGDEGAEDTGGIDAADFADFGGGDGLLVGDDGEGFERLKGEFKGRLKGFDEGADGVVVFGAGTDAEAAGDFANFEAAVGGVVVGDELVDEGADFVADRAVQLACSFLRVSRGLASAARVGGQDSSTSVRVRRMRRATAG